MNTVKTFTFHVVGMHCKACVVLTEEELSAAPEVKSVKASLEDLSVAVTGDFGDKTAAHVAQDLSAILQPHGYSLSLEKTKHIAKWKEFQIALPIAIAFIASFVILQKIGIANLVNADNVTFGTAFIIGIIASVSTCMAVVGGLVLSVSANYSKEGDKFKPQLLFHVGRLISFFVLGGVIGALGSVFQLGVMGNFILAVIIAIVLILLGLNLLDIFPAIRKVIPSMPKIFGAKVHNIKNINHTVTPLLLGVATFFLPCGFTQTMQIFTLKTQSFLDGGLTMFIFALGTLPVLSILSFGSSGIHDKVKSGVFFKTAGLVVIFFGIYNLFTSISALRLFL